MTVLPDDWRLVALGDLCSVVTDGSHFSPATVKDGLPYVTVRDIKGSTIDLAGSARIAEPDFQVLRTNGCQPLRGDVLFSKDGTVGRVARVRHDAEFVVLSSLAILRPKPETVLPEYLEHVLTSPSVQQQILDARSGTALRRVTLRNLKPVVVPVPPLDEQRRIVELLEDHLSRVDAAELSLRQADLRLDALERSALDSCFGVGSGGVPLSDVVEEISAGKSFGTGNAPAGDDEWGIVKVSAMTWGEFRSEENKAVSSDRVDPRFEIREGDLLVSRANTSDYVGASVLVGPVRPKLLLSDKSLRVQPRPDVSARWLWRALQAPSARSQISALATGTKDSMRNISQGSLLSVRVPDADRDAQSDALRRFDEITSVIGPTKLALVGARRRSQALRRRVLAAAFSGELGACVSGRCRDGDTHQGDLGETETVQVAHGLH